MFVQGFYAFIVIIVNVIVGVCTADQIVCIWVVEYFCVNFIIFIIISVTGIKTSQAQKNNAKIASLVSFNKVLN